MFTTEQIKSMNELELSVYQYIMEKREAVRYMKIRDLAEGAHVSTTTVLRFCKKAGCDGYAEFKIRFKQYLEDEKGQKISEDASEIIDCLKKVSTGDFEKKIEELTDIVDQSKRVIFVGSGMSGIVAKYGARYFSSIGKFSLYIDEPHYPTEGQFFEHALVIVFSVSGESNDTIGHINRFKKEQCRILSVTNTENCTVARISDYNIAYYAPYVRLGVYDITTQIPAISIIERIGRKLYNRMLPR